MKRIARFLLITTAVAAIAAMGVIGCNNGAGGGEMVNSYLSRFDPPNSGDGGENTASVAKYAVTFDGNGNDGGDVQTQSVDAVSGSAIKLPGQGELTRTGYVFGGWNTENDGTGNTYSAGSDYTVTGAITLYAKWTPIYTLETNVTPAGGGTVTRDPGAASYEAGAQVTVTAAAAEGYTFTRWTGDASGSANSITITMNGNVTVTANFTSDGTFKDDRDGKRYRKVPIGGKEWMAENLNYETGNSWCYDCGKYGRLYDWSTAMTACPSGWHLPSSAEWDALMTAVGGSSTAGKKLKSISGWYNNGNGTDEYGFSALPGGYRSSDGDFGGAGNYGGWWTATESNANNAYYRDMGYNGDYVYSGNYYKSYARSVRCVGDD
jgi:uncharacterized protein (TIGR02145 family)/uncharacterized repeat protein (TIGR02543 family)